MTIEVWERFEEGGIHYFDIDNQETLQNAWSTYIADIEKDANELRCLQTILRQKIEAFDNMRNGASRDQAAGGFDYCTNSDIAC